MQYLQTLASALIISAQKGYFLLLPSSTFDFEDTTLVSPKKEN